jgi:hypothetical protein
MRENGFIIYQGPSKIDGAPIVVIATGFEKRSGNSKTGNLIQTWIERADMSPLEARAQGLDPSICGSCRNRSRASGGTDACYVDVGRAPEGIWHAYHRTVDPTVVRSCPRCRTAARRGKGIKHWVAHPPYGIVSRRCEIARLGAARDIRIGAHGDPAAVPGWVWNAFTKRARSVRGYTHRWKRAQHLRGICRASVDTPKERTAAKRLGWMTFRVRTEDEPRERGEARCPASKEAGARVTCETCPIGCSGESTKDVTIIAHGSCAGSFRTEVS